MILSLGLSFALSSDRCQGPQWAKLPQVENHHSGRISQSFHLEFHWNDSWIFKNTENRGSSVPENDRLASIAAELQFRSLSRHSSPTEERDGECEASAVSPTSRILRLSAPVSAVYAVGRSED